MGAAHLVAAGVCLAGAASLNYRRHCPRDVQSHCKTLGLAGLLPRPFGYLQPLRWVLHPMALVALCSASAREGPPQPEQFSLVRIAGDGRCLFRALSLGAHVLDGKDLGLLSAERQTEMADALRQAVCQELHARRADIEPFIDADFGDYVNAMGQPRTWGGEPELAVAPHVLKRPISVYTAQGPAGLSLVSQYGQEEYPCQDITLLFHGAGHYDLLLRSGAQAKL